MDIFSKTKRSWIMSRVGGKNTKPEILVRSLLHRMGYRFRLDYKSLPGRPDIVLPKFHKVIFVHGCFWHGHPNCHRAALPQTNVEFWTEKMKCNGERDLKNIRALRKLRWKPLIIWQCEIRNLEKLERKIVKFITNGTPSLNGR
jgi:DNA mismatch endonuclease (patch repair protein)